MTDSDISGVTSRLDALSEQLTQITADVKDIRTRCEPCSKLVAAHQKTIHGNGKDGLLVDVAKVKTGRVDTLTVKAVVALVSALGVAMAGVIAAMATFAQQ